SRPAPVRRYADTRRRRLVQAHAAPAAVDHHPTAGTPTSAEAGWRRRRQLLGSSDIWPDVRGLEWVSEVPEVARSGAAPGGSGAQATTIRPSVRRQQLP